MKKTMLLLSLASMLVASAIFAAGRTTPRHRISTDDPPAKPHAKPHARVKQPKVDLVIALDTSGSMGGLINAAREKLWVIVNEVAKAQPAPKLRVGLLTYGSSGSERDGYVIVRSDLTTDLDSIYSKLFELSTSGGTEYVGRVVHRATRELSWDRDPDTLKQIYVAGNESADQDRRVSASSAVANAREHGIFVNALYCGNGSGSEARGWRTVAQQGNGMFAAIDHNHGTIRIATPYDAKMNSLSARLNSTYIGYGSSGRVSARRQKAQDRNAASLAPGAGASRAMAKASSVYDNAGWDLVDARKKGKKVARKDLPAELQSMNEEQVDKLVQKTAGKRDQIRREIRELAAKRRAYLAKEMKRQGKSEGKAFDGAVRRALRTQAAAKGIQMK